MSNPQNFPRNCWKSLKNATQQNCSLRDFFKTICDGRNGTHLRPLLVLVFFDQLVWTADCLRISEMKEKQLLYLHLGVNLLPNTSRYQKGSIEYLYIRHHLAIPFLPIPFDRFGLEPRCSTCFIVFIGECVMIFTLRMKCHKRYQELFSGNFWFTSNISRHYRNNKLHPIIIIESTCQGSVISPDTQCMVTRYTYIFGWIVMVNIGKYTIIRCVFGYRHVPGASFGVIQVPTPSQEVFFGGSRILY